MLHTILSNKLNLGDAYSFLILGLGHRNSPHSTQGCKRVATCLGCFSPSLQTRHKASKIADCVDIIMVYMEKYMKQHAALRMDFLHSRQFNTWAWGQIILSQSLQAITGLPCMWQSAISTGRPFTESLEGSTTNKNDLYFEFSSDAHTARLKDLDPLVETVMNSEGMW